MNDSGESKEKSLNVDRTTNVDRYIEQMTPQQRRAYLIASTHLKSSFSIVRSNGYKEFIKSLTK